MAAADTILSLLKVGDEVLAIDDLYGGTRRLFEKVRMRKSGITFKFINYKDFKNVNNYITKNTKMIKRINHKLHISIAMDRNQ